MRTERASVEFVFLSFFHLHQLFEIKEIKYSEQQEGLKALFITKKYTGLPKRMKIQYGA